MPTSIRIGVGVETLPTFPGGGDNPIIDFLLLESSDLILLENGDRLILEA